MYGKSCTNGVLMRYRLEREGSVTVGFSFVGLVPPRGGSRVGYVLQSVPIAYRVQEPSVLYTEGIIQGLDLVLVVEVWRERCLNIRATCGFSLCKSVRKRIVNKPKGRLDHFNVYTTCGVIAVLD
jgi:hypothetical protein